NRYVIFFERPRYLWHLQEVSNQTIECCGHQYDPIGPEYIEQPPQLKDNQSDSVSTENEMISVPVLAALVSVILGSIHISKPKDIQIAFKYNYNLSLANNSSRSYYLAQNLPYLMMLDLKSDILNRVEELNYTSFY
ncbi:hypothetical protein HHI36_023522, partial [Cryptolaemus montrouzieri]